MTEENKQEEIDEIKQAAGEVPEEGAEQSEKSESSESASSGPKLAGMTGQVVEIPEDPYGPEKEEKKEAEKKDDKEETKDDDKEESPAEPEEESKSKIFALRTTANREDQVMDFVISNVTHKKLAVFSVVRPHGMRGYIFVEAASKLDAEHAAHGIPYARGILPKEIDYSEMEHMIEPVKRELTIKKNDIVEIISGPFKRETAKITRIDEQKEEVVVELVEAAVPIPITLKIDAVKVIRRDTEE